ncbi:MAG: helix-turn-helix domain-containing protein [Desulfovibrio sp.]|jgi:excisionase family DNA binding protein
MKEYSLETLPLQDFYTLAEVAGVLRMDPKTMFRRIIKRRRIAFHQESPGSTILIRRDDFLEFLARMRVEVDPELERPQP